MGQRNRIALDHRNTRCILFGPNGAAERRFSAFEMSRARKADAYLLRRVADPWHTPTREESIAASVRTALSGPCCYALHCAVTDQAKIGFTSEIFRRWAKIELEGGRLLQLIAVWRTERPAALERNLHQQLSASRRIGEWFSAEPVVSMIRAGL